MQNRLQSGALAERVVLLVMMLTIAALIALALQQSRAWNADRRAIDVMVSLQDQVAISTNDREAMVTGRGLQVAAKIAANELDLSNWSLPQFPAIHAAAQDVPVIAGAVIDEASQVIRKRVRDDTQQRIVHQINLVSMLLAGLFPLLMAARRWRQLQSP